MKMHKWRSNASCVNELNELVMEQGAKSLCLDSESTKVLGVLWEPEDDCFRFAVSPFESPEPTKRIVSSVIAKQFDRLGLAAPIILRGKLLLQELWLLGIGWDERLPEEQQARYEEWMQAMMTLKTWKILR